MNFWYIPLHLPLFVSSCHTLILSLISFLRKILFSLFIIATAFKWIGNFTFRTFIKHSYLLQFQPPHSHFITRNALDPFAFNLRQTESSCVGGSSVLRRRYSHHRQCSRWLLPPMCRHNIYPSIFHLFWLKFLRCMHFMNEIIASPASKENFLEAAQNECSSNAFFHSAISLFSSEIITHHLHVSTFNLYSFVNANIFARNSFGAMPYSFQSWFLS